MRDLAPEARLAAVSAAPDSAAGDLVTDEASDPALGADSDAGVAAGAVSDGVSDFDTDSGSAGAASGIRSGGDRAGDSDGERRTHTMGRIRTRTGLRMARLTLTTIGAVHTARLGRTARQPTHLTIHLTTTIPLTVRTSAVGMRTAMTAQRPTQELRNRIRPARILRCLDPRFLFT